MLAAGWLVAGAGTSMGLHDAVFATLAEGPVTAKACKMANASETAQDQRVGRGAVLAGRHALRRSAPQDGAWRNPVSRRSARASATGSTCCRLGGHFARLRGHRALSRRPTVLKVRAAVLDGRFGQQAIQLAA